jgi:deoxyribodipyrimidine photolyase
VDTAIVLFTRDLRLHDNPALDQACARARQVVFTPYCRAWRAATWGRPCPGPIAELS